MVERVIINALKKYLGSLKSQSNEDDLCEVFFNAKKKNTQIISKSVLITFSTRPGVGKHFD